MPLTTHSVSKHTVQVLTKKSGKSSETRVIVRLYDDGGKSCGAAVFENFGDKAPAPIGDFKAQTATTYMDMGHYAPFMEILRLEKPIFMKIAWIQTGPNKVVSDVSLDTKQEIIGEYFPKNDG